MPSKQSLRRQAAREQLDSEMEYRSFEVRASTLDVETRSIEALVSSEAPVMMPDYERRAMVPEVLLNSGVTFPGSRQVPLLDSHNRQTMANQLGSARSLTVKPEGVVSRLMFDESAKSEFGKVREGHATDVSAGYQVLKRKFVPEGKTEAIEGREFTGPVNVVTKWRLREVSLTPIGADEQAKLRGFDPQTFFDSDGEFSMNPELRKLLVSKGMAETLTDEEAQRWLIDNADKFSLTREAPPAPKGNFQPIDFDEIARKATEAAVNATRAAINTEREEARKYDAEVRALCDLAELPDEYEACRQLENADAVRAHLQKIKVDAANAAALNPVPSFRVTGNGDERWVDAISTAVSLRSCNYVSGNQKIVDDVFPVDKRAKGFEPFLNVGIFRVAELCLERAGINTLDLNREQIATCAMFGPEAAGVSTRTSITAYHTTSSFLRITQDAMNKSMMVGYQEAPSTWEGPMRRGPSVPDFKTIHRIALGGVPNLPIWPDNTDPNQASFADGEETYAVECRSLEISYSYRLLVNDDMSALSSTPGKMGQAARRTVNALAWSIITSNPTMRDSVALFSAATGNRKRDNLQTGAGVPSATTLGTMRKNMRLMRGENTPENAEGDDVLNLEMRYLAVPAAVELVASQVVNTAFDPNSTIPGVWNPNRLLTLIVEPLLDANSATAYYGFCLPSQMDTVEVTFLQGQETPQLRPLQDERKLSKSWIVLQTFGAKALNHRGIQKHNGA